MAELIHGFPASLFQPTAYSPSIDMHILSDPALDFLPNMWQLATMDPVNQTSNYYALLMYLAPCAVTEVEGWHLPSFSGEVPVGVPGEVTPWPGRYPASVEEASDRTVYTVLNLNRMDAPTELYGA